MQFGGPDQELPDSRGGDTDVFGREHRKQSPGEDGHKGGDQDVDLGLLADEAARFRRYDGYDQHRQRTSGTSNDIGRRAHCRKAEQYQGGDLHGIAYAYGHRRPYHVGVACEIAGLDHELEEGVVTQAQELLPEGPDDGAGKQGGEEPLRHTGHRIDQVSFYETFHL